MCSCKLSIAMHTALSEVSCGEGSHAKPPPNQPPDCAFELLKLWRNSKQPPPPAADITTITNNHQFTIQTVHPSCISCTPSTPLESASTRSRRLSAPRSQSPRTLPDFRQTTSTPGTNEPLAIAKPPSIEREKSRDGELIFTCCCCCCSFEGHRWRSFCEILKKKA